MPTAPLPRVDTAPGLLLPYGSDDALATRCPSRRRALFTLFPLTFLCTHSLLTETPPWGFFSGTPKTETLGDGRRMRLLEDFSYTDPNGRTWTAPTAAVTDRISIPRIFRSLIGNPREGKYRNAAIIHDIACDQKTAGWQDVHLTFYFAMRCSGVGETTAKIIYYAVHHFGPRWGVATGFAEIFSFLGLGNENMRPLVDEKTAAEIVTWIAKTNPDLAELQATKPNAAKTKFVR